MVNVNWLCFKLSTASVVGLTVVNVVCNMLRTLAELSYTSINTKNQTWKNQFYRPDNQIACRVEGDYLWLEAANSKMIY